MDWMDDLDEEMQRIRAEMDKVFERFKHRSTLPAQIKKNRKSVLTFKEPIMHKAETEKSYLLSFELPGVKKGDISLTLLGHHVELTVKSGKSKSKSTAGAKKKSVVAQEFHKVVHLPPHIATDNTRAQYRDGILRLEFPKKKQKPSKIEIFD